MQISPRARGRLGPTTRRHETGSHKIGSHLINGIDRVSRSLADCIDIAESSLRKKKTHFEPERSSPRLARMGDIFSELDRIDSKIVDCIKLAKDTLRSGNSNKPKQWDSSSDPNCEEIIPEFLEPELDQEFISYLNKLDGPDSPDDFNERSDDIDLFMEGLRNPDKIEELWKQSKAKELWKDFLPNNEAHRTPKESNPQPTL